VSQNAGARKLKFADATGTIAWMHARGSKSFGKSAPMALIVALWIAVDEPGGVRLVCEEFVL
jgi:hypothetical protein